MKAIAEKDLKAVESIAALACSFDTERYALGNVPIPEIDWCGLDAAFERHVAWVRFCCQAIDHSILVESLWTRLRARQFDYLEGKQRFQSAERAAANGRQRGRPIGSGSNAVADAPLVEKILARLKDDPTVSLFRAAMEFADEAMGWGTRESKARRLMQRISDKTARTAA